MKIRTAIWTTKHTIRNTDKTDTQTDEQTIHMAQAKAKINFQPIF